MRRYRNREASMAAGYKTYRAMEQAVKAAAKASGRDVNKAIQAFYHDRFLCRVFSTNSPSFILKGGQSMLARIPNARETRDIDLIGRTSDIDEALEKLIDAASIDLDDFVEFRFKGKRQTDTSQDYREGYTVTFETWLGGTSQKGVISIDLVVDALPPEEFDIVAPVTRIEIDGVKTFSYLTNTAENRIAEKVCATMQDYNGHPSSRVKDLADLITSMINEEVDADKLSRLISTERRLRGINRIDQFSVPGSWKDTLSGNYAKLAKEAALPGELSDVEDAEAAVSAWLSPVFSGGASGKTWIPEGQRWA